MYFCFKNIILISLEKLSNLKKKKKVRTIKVLGFKIYSNIVV